MVKSILKAKKASQLFKLTKKRLWLASNVLGLLLILNCTNTAAQIVGKELSFQGHEVHYEIRGESEKTIVFIHGWSSNMEAWKFQLDAFPNYKVIAIDMPGHGKSSKEPSLKYSMEVYANTVKRVLDEEDIDKAFLLGHSMGFAIAEIVCYKFPEYVAGLGSIDGAHFELPEDEAARQGWIAYNNMMAQSMNEEKGREDFISSLFLEDTPKILKEEVLTSSKDVPLDLAKDVISSMTTKLEFWEKRVVQVPCIAVHSPVYKLTEEYKQDFIKMYPQAEYYTLEDVSHFLMLEVPYKINQMLHDYLEKVY